MTYVPTKEGWLYMALVLMLMLMLMLVLVLVLDPVPPLVRARLVHLGVARLVGVLVSNSMRR